MCYILTEKPCDVPGGIVPSVEQLEHLQEHILGLEQEKSRRLAEYRSTKRTIINLSSELEIPPSSQFDIEVVSGGDLFKPSAYNMEQLRSYSKELENKKQSHQQLAVQLRNQIKTMWTRLDISEDSMKTFLLTNNGCQPRCIEALEAEVARCRDLRREKSRRFISEARSEIVKLWDSCYMTPEERSTFVHLTSEEYTVGTLDYHEAELTKLRNHYEANRNVFDKVREREELWQKFVSFEQATKDPARLLSNRGCRVMNQEREKVLIKKKLPKIEEQLKSDIASFEQRTGRMIMIDGKPYNVYVRQQWDQFFTSKVMEQQQREENRKQQTHKEMMFGSHRAAAIPQKCHATSPWKSPCTASQSKVLKSNVSKSQQDESRTTADQRRSTVQKQRRLLQTRASSRRPLSQRQQQAQQYVVVNCAPLSQLTSNAVAASASLSSCSSGNADNSMASVPGYLDFVDHIDETQNRSSPVRHDGTHY